MGGSAPGEASEARALSVRLLGEITLSRGGAKVALPASKKTRALLGYLVTTNAPQSRQRLCDLFWDGPDDPRAALRWSLTKLRPLVDDDRAARLVADRERVGFEALGAQVDLFEASAHVGHDVASASTDSLRRAAEALAGDFLEGLELPDCYRFHEWCTGQREHVRALRVSVLDGLVERLTPSFPDEGLRYARQRLAADPLLDTAHATVVKLLARLGRNAEAQAQVDTCRRILDRELGGRRSPALDLARMEIGRTPAAKEAAVRVKPLLPKEPAAPLADTTKATPAPHGAPLVARAAERAALEDLVRRAAEGRASQVLLLSGEPGIGKSRLIGELTSLVREGGGTLLAGRAFEAESVRPFGVFIDILRDIPRAELEPDLAKRLAPLFPELGDAPSDGESKARLFDGVARLLGERAADAPLVLVVDDLHWLDEASAGLLHYVARVSAGTRLGIVCAARDGELEDNPGALALVRALRREARLVHVALAPLAEDETRALVRATAGPNVDATRVYRESGGNPLFAIVMAGALASGSHEGPQPLEALLDERLARLEARAREVVVWAAALGREFDPEILVAVTGENLGHTVAAIGELERSGLVSGTGMRYVFTHELIRLAAYRQLSGARRRLVHLTIARTLAAKPDPGELWGDVVHHATLADDPALVARACVAAGERALKMLARRQARDFATRGLAQAKRLGADGLGARADLLEVAGLSLVMSTHRHVLLEEEAEEALGAARELGRTEVTAKLLFALSCLRSAYGDFEGTHQVTLGAAEAARTAPPSESVPRIANTAFCLAIIERELPKARALLDEAIAAARAHRLSIIDIELCEGFLQHMEGNLAHAGTSLERGLALARSRSDAWRESAALIRLAMIAVESEAWAETRARAGELRAVAAKLGDGSEGAIADAFFALAGRGAGEAGSASALDSAIDGLARADAKALLAYVLTSAAEKALADGAPGDARDLAARALEAARPLGKPSALVLAHAVLGCASFDSGNVAGAREHVAAARELIDHPYGVSARSREALARLEALSNGGTNASAHGGGARRKRR